MSVFYVKRVKFNTFEKTLRLTASIVLLFFNLIFCDVIAQKSIQIPFENFSDESGLAHNSVNCILQDEQGFIWFGTQDGLSRFDAYQFTNFAHHYQDSLSISSSIINCIFQDKKKRIWLGTSEGINLFVPQTETFKRFQSKAEMSGNLSTNKVNAIIEDIEGQIWVATDGGIKKYNERTNTFDHIRSLSLTDNGILSLFIDSKKRFWVGTENGLFTLDTKKLTLNQVDYGDRNYIEGAVNAFAEDYLGQIWIGSFSGLFVFNETKGKIQSAAQLGFDFKTTLIQSLLTKGEQLWVGTYGGGLVNFNLEDKSIFLVEQGEQNQLLRSDIILTLAKDRMGTIWIGTNNGVSKFDSQKEIFKHYNSEAKTALNKVKGDIWSITEDSEGAIWVGTFDGLYRVVPPSARRGDLVNAPEIQLFAHNPFSENAICDNHVISLMEDQFGKIWAGTYSGGVSVYDKKNKTFRHFKKENNKSKGLSSNTVWAIKEDRFGFIWIGTSSGLDLYDRINDAFIHYSKNEEKEGNLSDASVTAIFEDRQGDLWVATKGGLNIFNRQTGQFKTYLKRGNVASGISHNYITAITQDKKGYIWLGTHGGGLSRLEKKTGNFENFTEKDGFSDDVIYALLEDHLGRIWLSTNKGLSRFDYERKNVHNYDVNDGLLSNRFNPNAVCSIGSGELIFGSMRGTEVFQADSIQNNKHIPPVLLIDFKVFNKSWQKDLVGKLPKHISNLTEIYLSHDDYVFTLEFVALNYRLPLKNLYKYKLEGFDEEWVQTDAKKRFATYSNLPPGEYIFHVIASNNDGIWNEKGASLKIIIAPPFWQEWWFRVLVLSFVFGIFFAIYKIRIRAIERQNMRLASQVKERTLELEEEKTKLESAYSEIIDQKNKILVINHELEDKQKEILRQSNDIQSRSFELQKSYENISILSKIGREITSILDGQQMALVLFERLRQFGQIDFLAIGAFDENKSSLLFDNVIFEGKNLPPFEELSKFDSPSMISLRTQTEWVVNDCTIENCTIILPNSQNPIYQKISKTANSAVCLPLFIQNRPIGVLMLISLEKNAFDIYKVNLVKALASYVSIALENTTAYDELSEANENVEKTNRRIMDSLRYANTIQQAFLPPDEMLNTVFSDNFVIFKPKDVVSGDFYWLRKIGNQIFVAVGDCTGHGVPGAFMSLIGERLLEQIIVQEKIFEPDEVLHELDQKIHTLLRQDSTRNDDGMDIILCRIDLDKKDGKNKIVFAGAKRPLILVSNKIFTILRGSRRTIGGHTRQTEKIFEKKEVWVSSDDAIYLTTDGYSDQNNPENKKIGSLESFLLRLYGLPLKTQKDILELELQKHRQNEKQRDDITILAFKI